MAGLYSETECNEMGGWDHNQALSLDKVVDHCRAFPGTNKASALFLAMMQYSHRLAGCFSNGPRDIE